METLNGSIQVSVGDDESTIGLLVERDGLFAGTILSADQLQHLAELLTGQLGFRRSPRHQSADM